MHVPLIFLKINYRQYKDISGSGFTGDDNFQHFPENCDHRPLWIIGVRLWQRIWLELLLALTRMPALFPPDEPCSLLDTVKAHPVCLKETVILVKIQTQTLRIWTNHFSQHPSPFISALGNKGLGKSWNMLSVVLAFWQSTHWRQRHEYLASYTNCFRYSIPKLPFSMKWRQNFESHSCNLQILPKTIKSTSWILTSYGVI